MKIEDKILTIMGWALILFSIALLILTIINYPNNKIEKREVDCFDGKGNRILGATCMKEYNQNEADIIANSLLICVSIFVAALVFSLRGRRMNYSI